MCFSLVFTKIRACKEAPGQVVCLGDDLEKQKLEREGSRMTENGDKPI